MVEPSSSRDAAVRAARLVSDHKAEDTVVLDLREVTPIADYFVITTARSGAHIAGLLRELGAFFHESGIRLLRGHRGKPDAGWVLLDCGDLVIHLMEKEQREFYDLEHLWFKATRVSY
jgi:ribosome-associated protein